MKKPFLTILLFSSILPAFCQVVSISSTYPLVLYQWLDNPLNIVSENAPCNKLVVKSKDGNISGNGCSYSFVTKDTSLKSATILVGTKNGSQVKWLKKVTCLVKPYPTPPVKLAWKESGSIPKVQLMAMPELIIPDTPFGFEETVSLPRIQKVIQFSVTILRGDETVFSKENIEGTNLPADAVEFIRSKALSKDVIRIDNITMLLYEKEHRRVENSISLTIE